MSEIVQPGQTVAPGEQPPFVRLPDIEQLFTRRAERFRALAPGHVMEPFLRFMADLADVQHVILQRCAQQPIALPDAEQVARAQQHAMPPVQAADWPRDPIWRRGLSRLLEGILTETPQHAKPGVARLLLAEEEEIEQLASQLLAASGEPTDPAIAPFLGAGLQVYFVYLASTLPAAGFTQASPPGLCPVCGSAPVGSVVRGDGTRYLHCSLCASEWNLARAKCSNCDAEKEVSYLGAESGLDAVKAEACDGCRSYLKVFSMEKDGAVDPVADDLASLALDLMLDGEGYARSGPNLMFAPGG